MSEQGTVVPGESGESQLAPQKYEEAVVQKAAEKGWRPLEEWEGDAADWVDAKEFIGRQKLYDRISELKGSLTKQQKEFQNDMKIIAANLVKVRETEYKKAKADLEAKREWAIENEDARAAVKVSKEIEELEKDRAAEAAAQAQATQTTGEATPEFVAWQEQNNWFQQDSEMRSDAISIGVGYAAGHPNKTQSEVLAYVTQKIKRMYPDKFEVKEKKRVTSEVEGNSPTAKKTEMNTRKQKLTLDDLPPEHQQIARTLIKRGTFKAAAEKNKRTEVEEYLASYQENA